MKTLIKSALIHDPNSTHHGKRRDVLLDKGIIAQIGTGLADPKAKLIEGNGLMVTAGWIDLKANFCDPGVEYKEDLTSGMAAASRGGFRKVVLMPSTWPVIDSKATVEYILRNATHPQVEVMVAGSLSDKMEGKQLSEMYDMHSAGAIAFTDDKKNVGTELMSRALEYAKNFGGLIMSFPYEKSLSPHGQMNEGAVSVSLGMKGIPHVSEEMRVQRDLELLRYHGGRLHFMLISTSKSVELIRKAKKEGLQVTCSIAAHQLSFLDEDLRTFDSNYKVLPPFRTKEERKALIAGIKDGTIDAICSDHTPEDIEHKVREFEDAEFGISSIETAFPSAWTALSPHMDIADVIPLFTSGPAKILGISQPSISEGNPASITAFTPTETTAFSKDTWKSKSYNSPFLGKTLNGKVMF
ncbi:MAG: dihydroorotase [Flavobacteriales bacterium]|nr:dihydroorotase [Flavobacteriales bacterium]